MLCCVANVIYLLKVRKCFNRTEVEILKTNYKNDCSGSTFNWLQLAANILTCYNWKLTGVLMRGPSLQPFWHELAGLTQVLTMMVIK